MLFARKNARVLHVGDDRSNLVKTFIAECNVDGIMVRFLGQLNSDRLGGEVETDLVDEVDEPRRFISDEWLVALECQWLRFKGPSKPAARVRD